MKSRSYLGLRIAALAAATIGVMMAAFWPSAPAPVVHAAAPSLSIDLEPNTPGIQSTLTVPTSGSFCAALVFENPGTNVGAFEFSVGYDQTRVDAPEVANPGQMNDNPDINEETGTASVCAGVNQDGYLDGVANWAICGPGGPVGDLDGDHGDADGTAQASCADIEGSGSAGSGDGVVAYILFNAKTTSDVTALDLKGVNMVDNIGAELGSCEPVAGVAMTCNDAIVTVGAPPPSATPTPTHTHTHTPTATNTPVPLPPLTFTVTSTADDGDASPGDGACASTGVGSPCTLRAAIQESNAHAPDGDAIHFAIGSGAVTITPLSPLPVITDPLQLDARTQPGFVIGGGPLVEIRGDSAGPGATGLYVTAGNSLIAGLAVNRFDGDGIQLWLGGGNTLFNNHVGTAFFSGTDLGNGGSGLVINESANNIIGSPSFNTNDYNVFSGNGSHGIYIAGGGSSGNSIMSNVAGINGGLGNVDVGNDGNGLLIDGGASATQVEFNAFSGNGLAGIHITSTAGVGNNIRRSTVGTDRFVTSAIPNAGGGIRIEGAGNVIGAAAPNTGSFVSGNAGDGILITGATASGNVVFRNFIGTDFAGIAAIANSGSGVRISLGAQNNTVGQFGSAGGNVISGNGGDGITICCTLATSGNVVIGNVIGAALGGLAALPNGGDGISIGGAEFTRIGAAGPGGGNVIAGNGSDGIQISGAAVGRQVLGNYIGLGSDGMTSIANAGNGISLPDGFGAAIGSTSVAGRNVISANGTNGVFVGSSGSGAIIRGNYIGTDATGMLDRGNTESGVRVLGNSITVGGSADGERNVISGNGDAGVWINGGDDNRIDGNYIGTAVNGTTLIGNVVGVRLTGADQVNNVIGGAGNVIAGQSGAGVSVDGALSTGNGIRANRIFLNSGAPIELTGGANAGIAAPTITGVVGSTLAGTACALCEVDIFSDSASQARTFEGTTIADGAGNWSFDGEVSGPKATAAATDGSGNTSALSAAFDLIVTGLAGISDSPGFEGDGGGAAAAKVDGPRGVFRDANGIIYVADTDNNRIRTIAADAIRTINTFAGSGIVGSCEAFAGDGGPATSSTLCFPHDVFVAPDGDVYIADTGNCRVRKVSAGTITTVAGTAGCGYNGDGIAATSAQLNSPRGIALDAAGNLYIADTLNHRVRKVSGGVITTIAGGNSGGYGGDLGAATSASLNQPHDVYIALGTDLMIADTANNRIRRLHLSSGRIFTLAGTHQAGALGDGGLARLAQLNAPEALAADASGNLFVADTGNNKLRRIQAVDGIFGPDSIISTIAGTGVASDSGDGGGALLATLDHPGGIAVGAVTGAGGGGGGDGGGADESTNTGAIAFSDTGNERLREVQTVNADGEPESRARPATSCVSGSVTTADFWLIGLVPLGMVAVRKRGRWLFTMLVAFFRRPAPQPV